MGTTVLDDTVDDVQQAVKSIARKYFEYMIECFDHPEKKDQLLKDPHNVLKGLGITIPPGANITLVTDRKNWQGSVKITRTIDRKTITLTEGDLEINEVVETIVPPVNVPGLSRTGNDVSTTEEKFESSRKVEKSLDVAYRDVTVDIQLPFFDLSHELLTEMTFEGGDEKIVLSCH